MKKYYYLLALLLLAGLFTNMRTASAETNEQVRVNRYTQNFANFTIDPAKVFSETRAFDGGQRAPYTFSLEEGALRVDVDKNFAPTSGNNNFVSFRYNISPDSLTVVDINEFPYMSFKVKASQAISYRVQVFEANGIVNASGAVNRAALETTIPAANEWTEIFVDFTKLFIHVTNSNQDTLVINDKVIFQFLMVPNFGAANNTWQGTVWVDDIKLGKAAAPKTRKTTYTQNFANFTIDPAKVFSETRAFDGGQRAPYTFSLEEGALRVDVDKNFAPTSGNNNFVSFRYNISPDSLTVVDINEFPYMSFKVKASQAISYRVQVFEANGIVNASGAVNRAALETTIPAANEWTEIFVDFTKLFIHVTNSNQDTLVINDKVIFQFLMVPNFGAANNTWQGTVWVDDIKLGKAAAPKTRKTTYTQNFANFTIDPAKVFSETRAFDGGQRAPYTFSLEEGALRVDVDKNFAPTSGNNNFVSFRYNISPDSLTVVDINEFPYMSFKVKASQAISYRVQVFEANGIVNASGAVNRAALETTIPAANEWTEIFVDFTKLFIHVTNSNQDTLVINDKVIFQFLMVPNFGAANNTWQGTVWVDDIKLGEAAKPPVVIPSSNNYLASVTINGTVYADFNKETLLYEVMLPVGTSTIPVVTATAEDASATIAITPAAQLPGTTSIRVTAEDGSVRIYSINFTVDDTGINELVLRSVIYPNPVLNILNIESTNEIRSIQIFSINGQAFSTEGVENGQISVHHLHQGMYLLRIKYIDDKIEHMRFLKK
jgi:hypothetical protein